MRLCKEKIVAMVICIVFMLIAGTCFYSEYIRIQNIFDKMYYTRVRAHYDWWGGALGGLGNKADSFSEMPQIKQISRDMESNYTSDGYFENFYKDEYLNDGEVISIACDRNESVLDIAVAKRVNGIDIIYRYSYDVKTKQLQENVECRTDVKYYINYQEALMIAETVGITNKELLEYRQYLLYDKLLTDWLDANLSRFSVKRWGRVKFIEVLPSESSK